MFFKERIIILTFKYDFE